MCIIYYIYIAQHIPLYWALLQVSPVTSHGKRGISNHFQGNCLFNSLFILTTEDSKDAGPLGEWNGCIISDEIENSFWMNVQIYLHSVNFSLLLHCLRLCCVYLFVWEFQIILWNCKIYLQGFIPSRSPTLDSYPGLHSCRGWCFGPLSKYCKAVYDWLWGGLRLLVYSVLCKVRRVSS